MSLLAYARPVLSATALALLTVVAVPACSSSNNSAPTCDDAKCAPGNKCLPLAGETKCRKTCTSNSDPATSCPFNYTCEDFGAASPFCVANTYTLTKKDKGQWGAPCNPKNGGVQNTDCDGEQGFLCYATSPIDAAAYCTVFDCQKDIDCAAGFWCATVNTTPNAATSARNIGETHKVCLKREYCAPCNADLDCAPVNGVPQHCLGDANGNGFCAPECQANDNCNNEASCVSQGDYKACIPRAGVCVGDGTICSPCHSDADCPEGACVKGQYTTEKSCTVKSKIPCNPQGKTGQGTDWDCPKPSNGLKNPTACLGGTDPKTAPFTFVPADQCHGVYKFSQGYDVGCWSPNR